MIPCAGKIEETKKSCRETECHGYNTKWGKWRALSLPLNRTESACRLPCSLRSLLGEKGTQTLHPKPSPRFCSGIKSHSHLRAFPPAFPQFGIAWPLPHPYLPDSSSLHFPENSKVTSSKRPSLSLQERISLPTAGHYLLILLRCSECGPLIRGSDITWEGACQKY